MGNHPSAVADDGQSSVHKQSYTVRGELYARAVAASTINAKVIYARKITCQRAQICQQQSLPPGNFPNTPHRAVTAHTVNADTIYADEINVKTLRCYDVYVGDHHGGEQWRPKRVEWQDRNNVQWDGREDEESDDSDNESDGERTNDEDRAKRKKMIKYGGAAALGLALGGAALAYGHHRHEEKEEREEKEKEELRRRAEEEKRREDEERRRREEEDKRRNEHHAPPPQYQQPMHGGGGGGGGHDGHHQRMHGGNYHLSSRNPRLWSDGNHCFLIAECDAGGGRFQESRIDLDEIITNRDGEFQWVHRGQPGNFSGSTERWEIRDAGNVMEADVRKVDGSMHRRRIVLSDKIGNENGQLRYLD